MGEKRKVIRRRRVMGSAPTADTSSGRGREAAWHASTTGGARSPRVALAVRFPSGRHHATSWGRHTNEAAVDCAGTVAAFADALLRLPRALSRDRREERARAARIARRAAGAASLGCPATGPPPRTRAGSIAATRTSPCPCPPGGRSAPDTGRLQRALQQLANPRALRQVTIGRRSGTAAVRQPGRIAVARQSDHAVAGRARTTRTPS